MISAIVLIAALLAEPPAAGSRKTILAIGAHCGDAEIASGAILAKHRKLGDRIAILHMTLGEGGNPKVSPEVYGAQKRREALSAAGALGAEVIFGAYRDGEIPNDENARRFVAGVIRRVQPTHIITHWKNSIHKDHAYTSAIVNDAVLLASLEAVVTDRPRWRGVREVYYAENWEDPEGFQPYIHVDVSSGLEDWKNAVTKYEFIRGGISSFPYLDYYEALARVRGGPVGKRYAIALDVDAFSKKRVIDSLP